VADAPAPAPEQLARVCAVAEIQQLAYRDALAFDMRDGDGLLALWAPAQEALRLPDMNRATMQRLLSRFFAIGPSAHPYEQPAAHWPRSQIGVGVAPEELRGGRTTMPAN
jgi:hypothetical protein